MNAPQNTENWTAAMFLWSICYFSTFFHRQPEISTGIPPFTANLSKRMGNPAETANQKWTISDHAEMGCIYHNTFLTKTQEATLSFIFLVHVHFNWHFSQTCIYFIYVHILVYRLYLNHSRKGVSIYSMPFLSRKKSTKK